MKFTRFMPISMVAISMIVLAAFKTPVDNWNAKNIVYKVSYDATTSKITATEKLEVSSDMVSRNTEGKITNVNKDAILGQMSMAMPMSNGMVSSEKTATTVYALVSVYSMDGKMSITTDQVLLDYLQKSFESFSKHSFSGSDYSVSGKSWNCAGESCNPQVPAGVEVFVWEN